MTMQHPKPVALTVPTPAMPTTAPYAAALLRITMGVLFLAHAVWWKIVTAGMVHVVPWFVSQGYPAWFAWFVTGLELLGGVLLILGWRTREVALVLAVLMAGITWQQFPNGWIYTSTHGGWEYPAFWTIALIAQAGLGAGAWAVRRR
jgi:putative oxidoreductase